MMKGPVVITLGLCLLVIDIVYCHTNSGSPVNNMADQSRMFEALKRDLRQLKRENYHMKRSLHVLKTDRGAFQDALAKSHKQSRELKCIAYSDMANRETRVNLDPSISDVSANMTEILADAEKITTLTRSLSSMSEKQGERILQLVKQMNTTVMLPIDWIQYEGSCYYLSNGQRQNWTEANRQCHFLDAGLVVTETEDEAEFVANVVKTKGEYHAVVWIGANDIKSEKQWKWIGTEENVIVDKWAPGEPNNNYGRQDCAYIRGNYQYKWDDEECSHLMDYMCEKRSSNNTGGC